MKINWKRNNSQYGLVQLILLAVASWNSHNFPKKSAKIWICAKLKKNKWIWFRSKTVHFVLRVSVNCTKVFDRSYSNKLYVYFIDGSLRLWARPYDISLWYLRYELHCRLPIEGAVFNGRLRMWFWNLMRYIRLWGRCLIFHLHFCSWLWDWKRTQWGVVFFFFLGNIKWMDRDRGYEFGDFWFPSLHTSLNFFFSAGKKFGLWCLIFFLLLSIDFSKMALECTQT